MGNKWSQASFSSDALSFDRWNGIISRGNGSSVFTSLRTKCYRELVGFQFECISGIPVSLPLRCHIIPTFLHSVIRYCRRLRSIICLFLPLRYRLRCKAIQRLARYYRYTQMHNILSLTTEMIRHATPIHRQRP
jgi:hypothetical protein